MKIRLNTIDINLLLPTAYVISKKNAGFDGQFFFTRGKISDRNFLLIDQALKSISNL